VALDAVVLIEVADALILERVTGRRTDPVTGRSTTSSSSRRPPR
jgi:hypothetical protein